ncbi:MAG: response regulator transcription factor [Anaerolineae bacterium]
MAGRRVLVVASDPLARAGLSTLLVAEAGWVVVGGVSAGPDLPADVDLYRPDVILWDAGWELDDDALEQLRARLAALEEIDVPLILLVPDAGAAPDLWLPGVRALLLRDAAAEPIMAALEAAAQGLVTLDPALADALLERVAPAAGVDALTEPLTEPLTAREIEVLQLMAEGLSNRAIALQLGISVHTVKFHINAILGKLNAGSRTEAVVRATRLGLILL